MTANHGNWQFNSIIPVLKASGIGFGISICMYEFSGRRISYLGRTHDGNLERFIWRAGGACLKGVQKRSSGESEYEFQAYVITHVIRTRTLRAVNTIRYMPVLTVCDSVGSDESGPSGGL